LDTINSVNYRRPLIVWIRYCHDFMPKQYPTNRRQLYVRAVEKKGAQYRSKSLIQQTLEPRLWTLSCQKYPPGTRR